MSFSVSHTEAENEPGASSVDRTAKRAHGFSRSAELEAEKNLWASWSNRIVGYSIADRMTSQSAVDASESAVSRRGVRMAGCTRHSDRGGQFRSRKSQHSLWRHQMRGSIGQVGSAGDNAAMESFFSSLQRNFSDRHRWTTREESRIAIVT
ncbi:hypothetical protein OY671_001939 [Metschnikowia pulcherrima]|nr:hypothetical protein OY671_001939 [Metschnikowia pulcherrima]